MDEELLARQQPQSLEAEQAVLGSILIDSRCVAEVIGILKPEDFYLEQNREIYETVYTMFNFSETIDPVTVLDKLKELGYYHDNSKEYVMQLMEITPTAANVVRYANIVQEKSMLRGLGQAAGDISEMVYEQTGTAGEILETAEKRSMPSGRESGVTAWSTSEPRCTRFLTAWTSCPSRIPPLRVCLRD